MRDILLGEVMESNLNFNCLRFLIGILFGIGHLVIGVDKAEAMLRNLIDESLPVLMHANSYPKKIVLIRHDPKGATLNHDYFTSYRNGTKSQLLLSVDRAHTAKILGYMNESVNRKKQKWKVWALKRARHECDYVLERLVNHPKALLLCVNVVKLLNQPRYLMKYYVNALKLYPQYSITHAQFGRYLSEIGDHANAILRLNKAIAMDGKSKWAYFWLAEAYEKAGESDLSKQAKIKALELGYADKFSFEIKPSLNH